MIYVSSDHHFSDFNFLKYNPERLYKYGKSISIIDKLLIEEQNTQITNNDTVYYLGDLSKASISETLKIIQRLNGNIKLLMGNHDTFKKTGEMIPNKLEILNNGVYRLEYKRILFNLFHYPLKDQPDFFENSIHLHGHTHGQLQYDKRAFDVGYDFNDYKFLSLDSIINKLKGN